jgi:hypothetical protein
LVYRFAGADSALFASAAIREELERTIAERNMPADRVFMLSDEAMLGPYCGDSRVFCRRLKEIFGDPKVLITIRRQDELLISWLFHMVGKRYARPMWPMLGELEAYADNTTSLIHYLDYDAICRMFAEEIGRDNLLILPYELFATKRSEYAARLSAFMNIDAAETLRLLDAAVASNQRQKDASAAYFDFRARFFPSDIKTPRLDDLLMKMFDRFSLNAQRMDLVRAKVRDLCNTRFGDSNRRMADNFSLDLRAYRYPGLSQ